MIEEFLDLVKSRRTVRRFRTEPVTEEQLNKILEAGRHAPSGANAQPWEFVVVTDPALRQAITAIFAASQEASKKVDSFPAGGTSSTSTAPAIIVVCADPRFKNAFPFTGQREHTYIISVAAAIQQMHLAAQAQGLAASWRSVNVAVEKKLKELLAIPDCLEIFELIPVGYPEGKPRQVYRRPLESMVHTNRFDASKLRSDEEVVKLCDHNRPRANIYSEGRA